MHYIVMVLVLVTDVNNFLFLSCVVILFHAMSISNSCSRSRIASDCSSPSSPTSTTATNKPADCSSSSLVAASVQHSTNCTNSLSCHSDVNCSNINTDLSPYSPMQISTDGSHMGRSSNSEESLGKSPVKELSSYCETDQKSISVPSTPNNNSTGNRDLAFNGNNFESNINAHIGISTLQQVFGKSNSDSSISLEHRSSEVVDDVKFKQDSGETVGTSDAKFSDKSPVKSSEGALALKTMNNGSEVMKGQKGKSADFASKSPTKSFKQDYKNRELVMSELMSIDSSSAAGDGSSQPSPTCHKVGRKGVNTTSNYVLKLSDKGRRSGKAHRMVQNVTEGSSTSSSFDEEQMVSHRKVSSSKRRDGSLRNVAEASVLAVGNSPTHSSTEHRKIADRVVVDSFGDPDFGTPV